MTSPKALKILVYSFILIRNHVLGWELARDQKRSRRLSLNCPCGNSILLRVQRPLPVIRLRRVSRCDRGAGGVVEQWEPHVNEHLHLRLTASCGSRRATQASQTVLTRVLIAFGAGGVQPDYFGIGTLLIHAVSKGWVIRVFCAWCPAVDLGW